ncbi:MAG: hypothetical protein RL297_1730 [Pseudomonadota bacterium]|jgi:hypothetical protein
MSSKKGTGTVVSLSTRQVQQVPLSDLDFDVDNPRFGADVGVRQSQQQVLNHLVRTFGIDDVLSSIAVNGYFEAEPMICRRNGARYIVVEGNRRLAACLILAGDDRAQEQAKLSVQSQELQKQSGKSPFDSTACIVFEAEESKHELLAYLGVRHIASSQGWDSFAKAAWISRAVQEHSIPLADIAAMTGDQNKTVSHLLEGYYFVQQLIEAGYFDPNSSQRKGRGSNSKYPFSWVYTLLFSPTARQFVGIEGEPRPNPIPQDKLPKAGLLLERMFGTPKKPAAIDDSRDITRLARTLDDNEKIALLEAGRHIDQIEFEVQPLGDKLRKGIQECRDKIGVLMTAVGATPPDRGDAEQNRAGALALAHLTAELYKKLDDASKAVQLDLLPPQE